MIESDKHISLLCYKIDGKVKRFIKQRPDKKHNDDQQTKTFRACNEFQCKVS